MNKIKAIYLVFFKGYSVVRFCGVEKDANSKEYGACSVGMEYNYGHNGSWGVGDTPAEAVIDCFKQTKKNK
jgi:hypothetical protein